MCSIIPANGMIKILMNRTEHNENQIYESLNNFEKLSKHLIIKKQGFCFFTLEAAH